VVIVSALFTAMQRLMGDVATMTVGWATVLLFGRVPQAQQRLLTLITMGSLVWLLALICLGVPAIGGFVLSAIPRPGTSFDPWFQVVLLVLAICLPLVIGVATATLEERSQGPLGLIGHVARGYPLAAVLGATTNFLIGLSLVLKARALQRGWKADHLPMIIKPGCYEAVAADLEGALQGAGVQVRRERAPWALTVPPKLIVAVGGGVARNLVPDELAEFRSGDDLWILLYPSDVALVGQKELVARARAAIAMRLTFADVYLTSAKESEQVEDHLANLSEAPQVSATDFRTVDELLASLVMPYDEWQTLYRLRLQVELQHRQVLA
jgi:hypothetical protein